MENRIESVRFNFSSLLLIENVLCRRSSLLRLPSLVLH